jgi:hypothetical protein
MRDSGPMLQPSLFHQGEQPHSMWTGSFHWLLENLNHIRVKFGSIDSHSPMRGHMGHPEASQGDLENQPVL